MPKALTDPERPSRLLHLVEQDIHPVGEGVLGADDRAPALASSRPLLLVGQQVLDESREVVGVVVDDYRVAEALGQLGKIIAQD